MRKLFALVVLTVVLSGAAGCRIGECWNEACCSHCRPRTQTVVVSEPCMVTDSCCGTPCMSCGAPCPCNAAPVISPVPR